MDLIKPMLASPSTGTANRRAIDIESLAGTHTFDVKLDGLRAIAYYDGERLCLVNRSGVDITAQFPEIEPFGGLPFILDGEIVADDDTFQTAATRGKLTRIPQIRAAAVASPCKFIAFDLLAWAGESLVDHKIEYSDRRASLEGVLHRTQTKGTRFGLSVTSDSPLFLQQVAQMGMEGVIAKRKTSRYTPGGRNGDWIKFKNLHRITAIAIGYEAGTGARSHFGAMRLALLDGETGTPVDIGRVGTGFSEREITELKARLDAGEPIPVEIELLNVTQDGALRFPVYVGVRSDLSVLDATLDQLATVPRC